MSARTRATVGAFEADAWAGLVVCLGPGRGAGVRLLVDIDGQPVDPRDLFLRVHEVGPHDPAGGYARVAFDLRADRPSLPTDELPLVAAGEASLVWEWARTGDAEVLCRVSVARPLRVRVQGVAPWDWDARWARTDDGLVAHVGGTGPSARVRVTIENRPDPDSLDLDVTPGQPALLRVSWHVGSDAEPPAPDGTAWSPALDQAAVDCARRRVRVSGHWEGLADAVSSNLHWMTLLQPELARRYVPAGRRWIFPQPDGTRDHWTIFAWDGFFNALLASLDDHALARDMVEAVLDTQYDTGNVPNWRSRLGGTPDRSQPPVGAFVVSRLVLRSGDLDLARRALPRLERWHAWWSGDATRPGRRRPSGLFAWGSDVDRVNAWVPSWERDASHRQKAAWESGQDDLPNWDDVAWDAQANTLAMDCVDLSSLLALDAECLAVLCGLVGEGARAATHRRTHARICALIDAHLWDERRGVYADRLTDGRFSPRLAASNFYPLLAGVAQGDRLARALGVLTDPRRFWGEWIVPTIARDDPAHPDQQYWRGTIWPPVNLLLHEGLRRARADAAAAHLAARSVELFLGDWRARQVCRENFSSLDGRGGGQRHQSWGPLFAWTGLAEFADVTPWDGLRLGAAVVDRASAIDGLRLAGHTWRIAIGPGGTSVACDGFEWLTADGPVCLRGVRVDGGAWRADATVQRPVRVRLASGVVQDLRPGTTPIVGAWQRSSWPSWA